MADTTPQPLVKFGFGQLMAHTPKWAKAIMISVTSALVAFLGLIQTVPEVSSLIPAPVVKWVTLAATVIAFLCHMVGLKNPFASTPDSKDVPLDTAGVDLTVKNNASLN